MKGSVVHLELHTPNLGAACAFYSRLLDWWPQSVALADAAYQSLELSPTLSGGIVECGTAIALGATASLSPREGPRGWRSVVTTPEGGEIALWQPKR